MSWLKTGKRLLVMFHPRLICAKSDNHAFYNILFLGCNSNNWRQRKLVLKCYSILVHYIIYCYWRIELKKVYSTKHLGYCKNFNIQQIQSENVYCNCGGKILRILLYCIKLFKFFLYYLFLQNNKKIEQITFEA